MAVVTTALFCFVSGAAFSESHHGPRRRTFLPDPKPESKSLPKSLTEMLKLPELSGAIAQRDLDEQRTERARIALLFLLDTSENDSNDTAGQAQRRRELVKRIVEDPTFIEWNPGDVVDEKPELVMKSGKLEKLKLTKNFDTSFLEAPGDFLDLLKLPRPKLLYVKGATAAFEEWTDNTSNVAVLEGLKWYKFSEKKLPVDTFGKPRPQLRAFQVPDRRDAHSPGRLPMPQNDGFGRLQGGSPRVDPKFSDLDIGPDPTYEKVQRAEIALFHFQSRLSDAEKQTLILQIVRARTGNRYTLAFLPAGAERRLSAEQRKEFSEAMALLFGPSQKPFLENFAPVVKILGKDDAKELFLRPQFQNHFPQSTYLSAQVALEKELGLDPASDADIGKMGTLVFDPYIYGGVEKGDLDALARRWLAIHLPSIPATEVTQGTAFAFAHARKSQNVQEYDELFARMPPAAIEKDLFRGNSLNLLPAGQKYLKLRYDLFRRGLHVVPLRESLKALSDEQVRLSDELPGVLQRALGADWQKQLGGTPDPKATEEPAKLPSVDRVKLLAALSRPEVASRISPSEAKSARVYAPSRVQIEK